MEKHLNLGIIAHIDAGKTTLTEQLLYLCGNIRQAGSVDKGTTQTDYLDIERSRGISVRTATTVIRWKGVNINLIDTPGHIDFAAEAERALRVLDCAILVLSAVEGVQARTEMLWEIAKDLNLPVIFYINKADRDGADIDAVITQIHEYLTDQSVLIQGVRCEENFDNTLHTTNAYADSYLREGLCVAAADHDEAIMAQYIEGADIPNEEIKIAIEKGCKARSLFPVFCGSALKGVGIEGLLDGIIDYFPYSSGNQEGQVSGIVFKVEYDKSMGRIAHTRLYSGTLKSRETVRNFSIESDEKITQIRKFFGKKYEDIGVLKAGDIAALCGLGNSKVGDILGCPDWVPRESLRTTPLLRIRAYPLDELEYPQLVDAMQELAVEDPLLDVMWMKEERELLISITGLIQLEVIEKLIETRYGLQVKFGTPSIIYKETITHAGIGYVRYTRPWPCWAVLKFMMEPTPRGSGVIYNSTVSNDLIYYRYQRQVENTVRPTLKQGPLGWEVTDVNITLIDGEHHIEHTHPLDFIVATPMAIMDGLYNLGTTLLEPMLRFRISVPEDSGKRVISDVINMRGNLDSPVVKNGLFILEGRIPAATSMDYSIRLSSISSGRGSFMTRFDGYEECPLDLGATTPYRGINPIDKSKYILHARSALQG